MSCDNICDDIYEEGCQDSLPLSCTIYNGPDISCLDIKKSNKDTANTAIKKIADSVCNLVNITNPLKFVYANEIFDDATSLLTSNQVQRIDNTLYGIIDNYTNEEVTFTKITNVNNSNIDGVIIRKRGTEFFKRNYSTYINVRWFGAKGDTVTDDWEAFNKAISASRVYNSPVFVPKGYYRVNQPLVTLNFRGIFGETKNSSVIIAGLSMDYVLDIRTMTGGTVNNIKIDCNNLAQIGIVSNFGSFQGNTFNPITGGSLNNSYFDLYIEHHLNCGWEANDNNDCYFERVLITGGRTSIRTQASGGPLQFSNCNFLGHVEVSAQYISFINCVTGGVIIKGAGFNVFKYEGGYAFPSYITNITFEIAGDLSNNGFNPVLGPISFSGSHLQVDPGGYLLGGTGVYHYGMNATGCHIFVEPFDNVKGNLIQSSLTTILTPACTSKFINCNIEHINLDLTSGIFPIEYEKCYVDNNLFSHAKSYQVQNNLSVKNGPTNLELFSNGVDDFGIRYTEDGYMNLEVRRMAGGPTGGVKWRDGGAAVDLMSLNMMGQLGLGTITPSTSSLLHINSTTKGVLIPKMTKTQRNSISSPSGALMVMVIGETGGEYLSWYNTSSSTWVKVTSTSD